MVRLVTFFSDFEAIYLKLLTLIHELLQTGIITTKRDLYYRDVDLFHSQATVDKAIEHLAFCFGVERLGLNIVASPKGCVFGDLTVCTKDGKVMEIDRSNKV